MYSVKCPISYVCGGVEGERVSVGSVAWCGRGVAARVVAAAAGEEGREGPWGRRVAAWQLRRRQCVARQAGRRAAWCGGVEAKCMSHSPASHPAPLAS